MNRYDALGTPLFDVFTNTPDMRTYTALPRTVADTTNPPAAAGAAYSALMDFRGPDRNPDLGAVLWWERRGAPPPGSRIAAEVASGKPPSIQSAEDGTREPDDDGEFEAVDGYLAAHPEIPADLRPRGQTPTLSKEAE
jgi:hypothetical protein